MVRPVVEQLEGRWLLASTISGQCFYDLDRDGVADLGEGNVAGRTVFADANNDGVLNAGEASAVTTASSYSYTLTVPGPGTYVVRQALPGGWVGTPASRTVTVSGSANLVNFGSYNPGWTGVVRAEVFVDANANRMREASEVGRAGNTLMLDTDGDGLREATDFTTTTNGQGVGAFVGVPPGTYWVWLYTDSDHQQVVPDWPRSLTVTVGTSGEVSAGTFGVAPRALVGRLGGFVFDDVNANGVQESGETSLLRGQTVYIDANNDGVRQSGERSFTTVVDGFGFPGLAPGTYVIRYDPEPGRWQSTPAAEAPWVVTVAAGQVLFNGRFGSATRDVVPPRVVAARFAHAVDGPGARFTFNEPVGATLAGGDVVVRDRKTDAIVSGRLTYDDATREAVWVGPAGLADGHYRLTLAAGAVADGAGNASAGAFTFDFAVMAGDANGDRAVDFGDLTILAQHYSATQATFEEGDFNYDGRADFADLVLIAQRYNTVLAAAPVAAPLWQAVAVQSRPAAREVFSGEPVRSGAAPGRKSMPYLA
jgi:hypothetical protein